MSQLICHSWHVLHLLACFVQLQSLLRRSAVSNMSRSFAHLISLGLEKAVLVGGSPTTSAKTALQFRTASYIFLAFV